MGGDSVIKKILGWTGNVLFIMFLILCVSILSPRIFAKNNQDELSSLFGYQMMHVLTGSMAPHLNPGDLILVKPTAAEEVKLDDIITFQDTATTFVTHRVTDIHWQDGEIFYETKGDANNIKDEEMVSAEGLVGTLHFTLPKVGYVIDYLKRPVGLMILVLVPLLYVSIGVLKKVFINKKTVQTREIKS